MLVRTRLAQVLLAALAAACMSTRPAPSNAPSNAPPPRAAAVAKPGFPELGAALPAGHTAYDNASLARLFTTLAHDMEWGERRVHLVRYETPVSLGLEGNWPPEHVAFVDEFLAMIASNADVAIARNAGPANLHVRLVDGQRFDSLLPTAFCVVAQGNVTWDEFARDPSNYGGAALAAARRVEHVTIFIPDMAPPFLVRNCLLEEIPQALGLANDLYGLGASIFNDDAAHLWPTKLDYLMLRVLYHPELETGLDRRRTELLALAVLERINPAGVGAPPLPELRRRALGDWPDLVRNVFSRSTSEAEATELAEKALVIVEAQAPMSAQHCHTLVTAGRLLSRSDPTRALDLFARARQVCDAAHGASDIRSARIRLEAACALLRLDRYGEVISLAEAIWPVLAAHGQDERLAALYTIESDALAVREPGSPRGAATARLADQWTAYALGPGKRAASCRRRS